MQKRYYVLYKIIKTISLACNRWANADSNYEN